ncbi:cytochrome P450 704C1-like isoform X2 [Mangifera indica]|nr:cytochrome P450 704C1-like isoform X2 [Mangifera indica]
MKDLFGQGILNVDGEKWRQQRKLASLEFSTRDLQSYSCAVFKTNAVKVVKVVSEFAIAGRIFDMQDMMMKLSLDWIFKVAFGVDLNCLNGWTKFMKALDESNALVYGRYKDPFWQIKKLLNFGSEASINNNLKVIDGFVHKLIHDKRNFLAVQQDYSQKTDLLSRFLVASEEDPETMNDKYLRDIILNFIFASKDPSATTLSWFFYMLCKNPLVQEKIVQEVRHITGSQENEIANLDDFVANITEETLDRMQYLHAALAETMRLYPAVPLDGKCAEVDDVLPDGYRVKKGDGIYYTAYAMARMPYIWGDDAGEFRPERWLQNGIFQPQSHFKFVSFHGGPRICLGKDLAYRQMKIASMALLHFFHFKLADDTKNLTYKTMFSLHIDGNLHLRAIPRKS